MAKPNLGDIIYVNRDCGIFGYQHFGVYSGNEKVIHYTKDNSSDDVFNGIIQETSLKKFLDGDTDCYAIDFDKFGRRRDEYKMINPFSLLRPEKIVFELVDLLFGKRNLYSPEETVQRAREHTKPGKNRGYNLFLHNCEHFAIWCKTGIVESKQVQEFIEALIGGYLPIHLLKL